MCCCCFRKSCCYFCWFIFAVVLAILIISFESGILIFFGGPIPTQVTHDGSIVLMFANACTVIFYLAAVIFLCKKCENFTGYVIISFFLVFTTFCSFFVAYSVSTYQHPSVKDVEEYSAEYAKEHNGSAPPFLDKVQSYIPCCGGEGFQDYVNPYPERPGQTFSLPDSCCSETKKRKQCGMNLDYEAFNSSLWFHRVLRYHSREALRTQRTLKLVVKAIIKSIRAEVEQKTNQALKKMIPNYIPTHPEDPVHVPNKDGYLPHIIINFISQYVTSCVEKTEPITPDGRRNKSEVVTRVSNGMDESIRKFAGTVKLKVNVFGCAALYELILDAKFVPQMYKDVAGTLFVGLVVLMSFQAVLNFMCLILFNVYYWKHSRNARGETDITEVVPVVSPTTTGTGTGFVGKQPISTIRNTAALGQQAGTFTPSPPPLTDDDLPFSTEGLSRKEIENMRRYTKNIENQKKRY